MKDCAIICGYPTLENGTLSPILESRIAHAVQLYQHHEVQYLLVSGAAAHNTHSEALAMAAYAYEHHVPQEAILIEPQAISTYHNMKYAKEIMDNHHLQSCIIVTNSWHMIKAVHYAKKFHLSYSKSACPRPRSMSSLQAFLLCLYMPLNMLYNRFKGYY